MGKETIQNGSDYYNIPTKSLAECRLKTPGKFAIFSINWNYPKNYKIMVNDLKSGKIEKYKPFLQLLRDYSFDRMDYKKICEIKNSLEYMSSIEKGE